VEHLAIDLGSRESQVCIRSADGVVLQEVRCKTADLGKLLGTRPESRVVMESCAEAFRVADIARALGHTPCVVPAVLVHRLGVGDRRLKTDVRDARALSEASLLNPRMVGVHVPSQRSRDWKALLGMRDVLVRDRTRLVNSVRGWLRGRAVVFPRRRLNSLAERVRQVPEVPEFVRRQLRAIDALAEEIRDADAEVHKIAEADEICSLLMTAPAVGPILSMRFVSSLDDVTRFPSAHRVESYVGLVPGENSSSDRQRRLGIHKAGCPDLRWVLIQVAWTVRTKMRADPLSRWAAQLEERTNRKKATVALARKLTGILYAMWRDGKPYHPSQMKEDQPVA